MISFDLFSIGHSNLAADRFAAMLRAAGAEAVADVRSVPASRFCSWFSAKNLAPLLAKDNIAYLRFGDAARRPAARSFGSRSAYCRCSAALSVPDVFGARSARLPSRSSRRPWRSPPQG
jgi:uncharacterized protein (DUF488 family)